MNCFGLLVFFHCVLVSPPGGTRAEFCQVYQPIYWSASDTRFTKEQVDKYNRVWVATCKEKK